MIRIEQINPHACKTYLIRGDDEKRVALVDPVLDHLNDYREMIDTKGLTLVSVVDTHTHADHISAGAALRDVFDCDYVMHTLAPGKCATIRLEDGDALNLVDGVIAEVLYSPGHTRDSVSLVCDGVVLTGDALFLDSGGAGRDDLPGGDPAAHWETLQRLLALPEELLVYPAHDYRGRQPSSLAQQKRTNPHLQQPSKAAYIQYIQDLKLGPADWMADVLKANYTCARDPGAAWIPIDSPACEVKGTLDLGINEIEVQGITVGMLRQQMATVDAPVLVDVRDVQELSGPLGQIEGVLNVPIVGLSHRLDELEPYRDRLLVTVCRSGNRAATAAQILTSAGFDVRVLQGGMKAWNGG